MAARCEGCQTVELVDEQAPAMRLSYGVMSWYPSRGELLAEEEAGESSTGCGWRHSVRDSLHGWHGRRMGEDGELGGIRWCCRGQSTWAAPVVTAGA